MPFNLFRKFDDSSSEDSLKSAELKVTTDSSSSFSSFSLQLNKTRFIGDSLIEYFYVFFSWQS